MRYFYGFTVGFSFLAAWYWKFFGHDFNQMVWEMLFGIFINVQWILYEVRKQGKP